MKAHLIALAAGLLVGVVYNLINLRAPAPPVTALAGLLGILAGKQIPPPVKNPWSEESLSGPWLRSVRPHVFGHPPKGRDAPGQTADEASSVRA
jgi:XapX domain-containing protein